MHSLFEKHGLSSVHVPFLEHEGLEIQPPETIPEVILVSSARTLLYWGEWSAWIRNHQIPVISISKKTKARLQEEGIVSHCAQGTGDRLVEMLQRYSYRSFCHIGALELSSKLESSFRLQTRPYQRIPVYRSQVNDSFYVSEGVDLGCLNSERCAQIWKDHAPQTPVICLGETTASRAVDLGLNVRGVAKVPSRESLFDAVIFALRATP
jgi:uroporphyrinogen-III synthase